MKHQIKIAPSLLSADFANLERDVKKCENAGAEVLHLDIMDGRFVPNITFGPLVVKALRRHTKMIMDCHLMIVEPDKYIPDFATAGADMISVHAEASPHLHRSLSLIRSFNVKAGLALNPVTPLSYALESAEYLDFILLMSVNPGFGGQAFINSYFERAKKLRTYLDDNGLSHVEIEIDGGVKIDNCKEIANAGANILVSGSGLFSGDLDSNIKTMRKTLSE